VFALAKLGLGVAGLVNRLEEVIIKTIQEFGVTGRRQEGHPGVWVGPDKIASIGLAVRRGVTFHGLSLNCNSDPQLFDPIRPCGLSDVRITSLAMILGGPVDIRMVRRRLTDWFGRLFSLDLTPWTPEQARSAVNEYERTASQTPLA
jgi:lipoate-protein ligase B